MKQWTEKDLKFILDKKLFPECVICLGHYFHKEGCSGSFGGGGPISDKQWAIINDHLNKRLEEFEKKHGVNGEGIQCQNAGCQNQATGQMHVLYHGSTSTVEDWPVCMDHSFHEDSSGRECQYRGF